jgi:hypothetical protein
VAEVRRRYPNGIVAVIDAVNRHGPGRGSCVPTPGAARSAWVSACEAAQAFHDFTNEHTVGRPVLTMPNEPPRGTTGRHPNAYPIPSVLVGRNANHVSRRVNWGRTLLNSPVGLRRLSGMG